MKTVAEELNVNPWTLKNWMKTRKESVLSKEGMSTKRPKDWSLAERLQMLLESHGMNEEALSEAAALLVLQKKYQALWEEKDG